MNCSKVAMALTLSDNDRQSIFGHLYSLHVLRILKNADKLSKFFKVVFNIRAWGNQLMNSLLIINSFMQ